MIVINLDKAKGIAHEVRRAKRTEEFKPLDIKATIPSESAQAEAERQVIREKYAQIQIDINSAPGVEELKLIVESL